jgi:hypothetical protein
MAVTTIKSTYSLDVETVEALEAMARRWRVSKSEALLRAIRLAALDDLQSTLDLDRESATSWGQSARTERHASSRNVEP